MNRIQSWFDGVHAKRQVVHSNPPWPVLSEEECRPSTPDPFVREPLQSEAESWIESLSQAIGDLLDKVARRQKEVSRLQYLAEQVESLTKKIHGLGSRSSAIVPITTFAPEPFEPLKEIKTVVEESEDEFIASFYDANVSAGGSNRQEAYENLKDLLLSRFDYLDKMPSEKLGPALQRQIAVLREFIRRRD